MFTSATDSAYRKTILWDLLITLFCALFGGVYEAFSHGVYAYPMLYAFAFPLVLGVLPYLLLLNARKPYPSKALHKLYHAGVFTLTVGSLVTGALEIYGTTNSLCAVYWIAGSLLVLIGAFGYCIACRAKRTST